MLSPQDRAEMARIKKERMQRQKKEQEARKKKIERLNKLNDLIRQRQQEEEQEEEEERLSQDDSFDDSDISDDIQDEIERIKNRQKKKKEQEKEQEKVDKENLKKNDELSRQSSPNEQTREMGHNNAPKGQESQGASNAGGGSSTASTGSAHGASNTAGTSAGGNVAGSGATASGTSGTAAAGSAGTGSAAAGSTAGGTAAAGSTAGGTAAAGGATAAAPVILIIIAVILVIALLVVLAGFLINSSIFTGAGYYDYNFSVDDTTVAQIISAREDKLGKPLLRFGVNDTEVLFFFSVNDSDMKDLLYNNMNKLYDDVVKEMDVNQRLSIASGGNEKINNVGDAITVKVKNNQNGSEAVNELSKYGSSGFSIKNYLLFLNDDEFTNSFIANTLTSRSTSEIYDDMLKQDSTHGDVKLSSISTGFRDLIVLKYGFDKAQDIFKGVFKKKDASSDEEVISDKAKFEAIKQQYGDLYLEYLNNDLTFSLIYKYLFCTSEQFNSIIWNAYEADPTNGTFKPMKFTLRKYKAPDSNQEENLYIPSIYLENAVFYDKAQYEKYIDEIISIVNPYLMHWVVPYALNVATSDYTFALDAMYNMKGPINLDVFKVRRLDRNEKFCIGVNRTFRQYGLLFNCPKCSDGSVYSYSELEAHVKSAHASYSSIDENITEATDEVVSLIKSQGNSGSLNAKIDAALPRVRNGEGTGSCELERLYNMLKEQSPDSWAFSSQGMWSDYNAFKSLIVTDAKMKNSSQNDIVYNTILSNEELEKVLVTDFEVYRIIYAQDQYYGRENTRLLCTNAFPLDKSFVIHMKTANNVDYKSAEALITFYWMDSKDDPNNMTYEEIKSLKCVDNTNVVSYKGHIDEKADQESESYKTKLKYAEGMYKVTYNEWVLIPFNVDKDIGLHFRDTKVGATGVVEVASAYEDSLDMGQGHYDRTYKLSYLKKEDYNSDGTRKNTNEKISRIEWFLDYGSGTNEMFPDKKDTKWYSMYDVEYDGSSVQNTFTSFYHVSFKEINKIANISGLDDTIINNASDANTVKNYLKNNYCKYIELKYKKNIESLNELLKSKELEEKIEQDTASTGQNITKLEYISKNYSQYTFELASVADASKMKMETAGKFVEWITANAWNYFCGKKLEKFDPDFYGDPSNLNPLIDACYRLNTVQGYDYKNLDFAFVEIESYYDKLPAFVSDMLGYNVVSEEISSLPAEGLKWPVSAKNSSSAALSWTYKNHGARAIDVNGGTNSSSRGDYNAIAATDGTVYVDSNIGRVTLLSENEKYLIIYDGVSIGNFKNGDKVSAGSSLGTISRPNPPFCSNAPEKDAEGKNQWYMHYSVAFNIDGFEKDESGVPIYGGSDLYDPTIFYTFNEDGTVESVTGSSGEYAVRERTVNGKVRKYKVFKQVGAYYSDTYFGYGYTIGQAGCPLIATSNALSALGYNMDPGQMWAAMGAPAGAYGVSGGCNAFGFTSTGTTASQVTAATMLDVLKNGGSIVFHIPEGTAPFARTGHWMSITDFNSSGQVLVNDGGYNTMDGYYSPEYILGKTREIVLIYPK